MTIRNSLRRVLLATSLVGLELSAAAQSLTITTLAGQTGASGSVDGTGAAARFSSHINSMVADASGNLHVIDANNYTVRRVTAAGVVTTIAGTAGQRAYVDGTGAAARFYNPRGLARDAAGNLYLIDTRLTPRFENTVRKISPTGVVTTYQSPVRGSTALAFDAAGNLIVAGGTQLQAFNATVGELLLWVPSLVASGNVSALAVGRDGSFFLLDSGGHEVRKMTPAGVVTPFAGAAGVAGYADGAGASARFHFPHGIALDSSGNAYVADGNNPVVRKITPAGVVTTVAGAVGAPFVPGVFPDGIGSDVRFFGLSTLTVGADDTVYLGEFGAIRKGTIVSSPARVSIPPQSQIVSAGERATFTVAASGFPAVSYQWQRSNAAGLVWTNVTDAGLFSGATTAVLVINGVTPGMNGDRFRCVVANALGAATSAAASLTVDPPVVVVPLRVSTLAGRAGVQGGANGAGANASFSSPTGIATDASGNVFVSDTIGNRVRKITPGGTVTTLAGSGVAGVVDGVGTSAQFRQPGALAIDAAGNVFVADQLFVPDYVLLPVIRKITPAGVVTTFARGTTAGPRFNIINGLAFDRAGNLVVASAAEGILRYTPNGTLVTAPLAPVPLPGRGGVASDAAGNFYFSDTGNHVIFKLTAAGALSVMAGRLGTPGAADGRATVAMFRSPRGLAVDRAGNIFVADDGNHAIRRITANGTVSTVAAIKPTANQTNPTGSADGIGSTARFYSPRGIAIDRAGNLYIADTHNHTVRRALPVDAIAVGQSTALYAQATEPEPTGVLAHEPPRAALGLGSTYQWFRNSTAIAGATSEQLFLASVGLSDQGSYTVQVTTTDGSSMSEPVTLAVMGSRLVNLSIRSYAGAGAETLIVGFVVSGPGLPLLARGIGPALAPFGVAGALSNPRLALYSSNMVLASNAGWGNSTDLAEAATRVGAFALPADSVDAVVLPTLDSGAFTVQCAADSGAAGVALVELYDASMADAVRSRLMNVSARSRVGTGDNVMIAGFSIRGPAPVRVLLRGVGPTLGLFGVEGALADPRLRLFGSQGNLQAQNDDWSDNTNAIDISVVSASVGAFPLPERSKDTALLVSLNPGTYSIQVSGGGAAGGIALVEVYEAP